MNHALQALGDCRLVRIKLGTCRPVSRTTKRQKLTKRDFPFSHNPTGQREQNHLCSSPSLS